MQRADVRERAHEHVDVVAVDRADVVEAEFLEQRAGQHHPLHVLFPALGELLHRRDLRQHFLAAAAHRVVEARREQAREVAVERADRLRDRHLVVVQHDEEVRMRGAGIVERLERHPRAHRAVADHRDDAPVLPAALRGDRHAERGGDRRRRVCGAERVVLALASAREPRGTARHPELRHLRAAARQDLVGIRLVADVPDDPVARSVVDVVERDRELDGAEIRRQMAAGARDAREQERAQLARELRQAVAIEPAQPGRVVDRFQEGIGDHQRSRSTIQSASSASRRPAGPSGASAA